MSSTQPTTARTLVAFGAFSQFVGMVLGMFVPAMPFPRLGLTGHISWMTTGNLCLTTGLVLYQPNLVPISAPLLQYVKWAFFSGIIVMISETLNAFWGTNQFLTIAAEQAGAPGGTPFQESFMFWAHVVPSLALIPAFGIVVWHLVFGKTSAEKEKL